MDHAHLDIVHDEKQGLARLRRMAPQSRRAGESERCDEPGKVVRDAMKRQVTDPASTKFDSFLCQGPF